MNNEPTTHVRVSTARHSNGRQRLLAVGGPMHGNRFKLERWHMAGEIVAIGRHLYRVLPTVFDGTDPALRQLQLVHMGDAHKVDL